MLSIYKETVKAINAECYTLAAAGFRAVIESICLDKQIEGDNLEAKVNNMQKAGIITMEDRNRLHSVRFLGNDFPTELQAPNPQPQILKKSFKALVWGASVTCKATIEKLVGDAIDLLAGLVS